MSRSAVIFLMVFPRGFCADFVCEQALRDARSENVQVMMYNVVRAGIKNLMIAALSAG